MKNRKAHILRSALTLLLCISMFVGSTFAWFTDSVTTKGNIIQSGTLNLEMSWTDDLESGEWHNVETSENKTIFDYEKWEPGYTSVRYIKLKNTGNLAFNYKLAITPEGAIGKLAEVIQVYCAKNDQKIESLDDLENMGSIGLLDTVLNGGATVDGTLLPATQVGAFNPRGEVIITLAMSMLTTAGNEYQDEDAGKFSITAIATQASHESDSFGTDYDTTAEYPVILRPNFASTTVNNVDDKVADEVTMIGEQVSATVPAGVALESGVQSLSLQVTPLENTTTDITVVDNEILIPIDVHVEGVSKDNKVPIIVELGEVLPKYLNMGNYVLYHVEDGTNVAMTLIDDAAAFTAHNQYKYDPYTGEVTVAMATFSEVALVANEENAWKGTVATAFAKGTGTETDPYIIANADQLAYMGDRVSNDNENYGSAHYQLVADINIGGSGNADADGNAIIFYPIGYNKVGGEVAMLASADMDEIYFEPINPATPGDKDGDVVMAMADNSWYTYGGSFKGVFDGMGHTITGIYQNTWAMKGDYDGHYYNDAMGLFGYVNGGTVKNLTIDNFNSEGEFAPTGCVTAYAGGSATFENIAITNSHPQTYNTGVAGIVGWDNGNSSDFTFKNITVDATNTMSALWGSWDVAASGILGCLKNGSKASFENCNVSATIDVYNDVCGNYQYYWYRYSGAFIGTVYKRLDNGNGALDLSDVTATNCSANFGDRHEYYYCEFVENTKASYTHDYQMSRVDNADIVGSGDSATCQNHNHEEHGYETVNGVSVLVEDKQAVYIPYRQLFGGYGWGVDGVDLGAYDNIDIATETRAEEKFDTKFTGDFLYRVGNGNAISIGTLFTAKTGKSINASGVYVTVDKVDENSNVSGVFTANTSDWTKGTIQFSGTGVVKVTIQDYDFCEPTELIVEVIDATNITSATGTTSGGDMVLLCDVNSSNYVYYWDCTLYGNGFTYSLNGAPTTYSSSHGHGVLITKNATLDNLVIVGDVYDEYGAYTNNNDYNAAIDVLGDTVIQNCYIANCAAPVSAREDVTIKNTTLYGGTVANLIIKSGIATLENVTTANFDDGRELVGMGIVVHSDATESAKLVLNGTLTQYNFISEAKTPSDTYAKNLHNAMFSDTCVQYHFGESPNRYVNAGIISLTSLFNGEDITDNANTGYKGSSVTVSGVSGYVYTQLNTSGSVNNNYDKNVDPNVANSQGAVPPTYSFDYTTKNYVAKEDGSNDYCYEENGTVYISMDEGESFSWDSSILTVSKNGQTLPYTVSMNGVDYTGKTIDFNTADDYTVTYTYTDPYNYSLDNTGSIVTHSESYTKNVNISVAVVEAATKHAEFTFGSSNTASTTVTVGNNTYVMPNVSATSSTIGSTTVSGQTIYYPIVEIVMSDGKTSHTSGWYAYFPVFSGAVTITDYKDNGLGDAETFGSSTQSMPSGLSIVGDPASLFKYQSSSSAGTSPVVKNNILVYSSPSISAKRSEYNTVIQYSYQDNAGTTYYYYIGYHAPAQSYTSCVTADTLVTLADGTQKRIDKVNYTDELLVWDFDKGEYATANASIIENHGYDYNDVIKLQFADGTSVKVVNKHGFFDADLDKWVDINAENAEAFIGHSFTRVDGKSYKTVKLVAVESNKQYVEAWSVLTNDHYNCILGGMFTITPPATEQLAFFDINADMKYDAVAKQADIENYGLYTYEEFSELMSKEQFEAFNIAEIKIAIGKGLITYEEVLALLASYAN